MTETVEQLPLADVAEPSPAEGERDWTVTQPGVYFDMPEDVYHADPVPEGSLSSSGARAILPPGCPAIFRWQQINGRPDKRQFDLGHAAHALVLGIGAPITVVQRTAKDGAKSDAPDYKTQSSQDHRDEIRAAGGTPLLRSEFEQVTAMAAALRQDPIAAALLNPDSGQPEVSAFWRDERSGVMLRVRFDWLPHPKSGRMVIPDYKTAVTADPDQFARSAASFGYPQQDQFYSEAVRAHGLAGDVAFCFITQAKTPPYLVTVIELDQVAKRIGRARNREAIDLYAYCRETDTWPGYADDVVRVSLPRWYTTQAAS